MPDLDLQPLLDLIAHHWGFRTLKPLQEQAMRAVLDRRDSLVVLPTGGGKSLRSSNTDGAGCCRCFSMIAVEDSPVNGTCPTNIS